MMLWLCVCSSLCFLDSSFAGHGLDRVVRGRCRGGGRRAGGFLLHGSERGSGGGGGSFLHSLGLLALHV